MGNIMTGSHLSAETTPRDETRSCGPLLRVRFLLMRAWRPSGAC